MVHVDSTIHNEKILDVKDKQVRTDKEGYIINIDEWTEDFAIALAESEGLELTDEHWEVIHYIRDYFAEHRVQVQVREMIKHFKKSWGPEHGNNHYLHDLFPKGGPQKQGNRCAGIHRTRGEH